MSQNGDSSVQKYRLEKLQKAPRMWLMWVAAFTMLNGILIELGKKIVFLVGMVAPFQMAGSLLHFVAGAALAVLSRLSEYNPPLLLAGIGLYVADTIFAGYFGVWSGLIMHLIALAIIGASWFGAFVMRKGLKQE